METTVYQEIIQDIIQVIMVMEVEDTLLLKQMETQV
jgi:hypothetical protein